MCIRDRHLKQMGYKTQFNSRRKYWTVTPEGSERPIRLYWLGEEYTNQRIYQRVLSNPTSVRLEGFQKGQVKVKQYVLFRRKDKIAKVGGLRGLYLKYCYQLGYLPKYKQSPAKVHYLLKDDLMKLDVLSKEIRLISKQGLNDTKDVLVYKESLMGKMENLMARRNELRNIVRGNTVSYTHLDVYKRQILRCMYGKDT